MMTRATKTPKALVAMAISVFIAGIMAGSTAYALGSVDSSSSDGGMSKVTELVEAGKYDRAIDKIETMLRDDPKNADLLNYLAYSQRQLGDYDSAAQNYERALSINPRHVGALEYQGELFLKTGKPEMARENLARIEAICGKKCPEYQDLAAALQN